MFYVYVVRSEKLGQYYIGQTDNVERRIREHNSRKSFFTSRADDWKLIYYEAFTTRSKAMTREKRLKTGSRAFQELIKRI